VLLINAAAEDYLSECGRNEQERENNGGSLQCDPHFQAPSGIGSC
jgi:hypothetical protein